MDKKDLSLYAFAINLGFRIAIPLVALTLLGIFLDNHLKTSPLFLLIGIGLSFTITSYMIYTQAIKVLKETSKKETPKEKDSKHIDVKSK